MIFQDLLLELMLQNEALAKIESVNLQALDVLKSSDESLSDISDATKPPETGGPAIAAMAQETQATNTASSNSANSTASASPNYSEELVSLGLEQVRVLEFILSEVKNGNSRIASVTDSVQQLTNAVVEGLEQSGTERLAAEEARREIGRDAVDKSGGGPSPEKKPSGLGLLGGLAMLAKLASEFIAGVIGSLKNAFQTVKAFFSKNLPKVFALAKSIFTSIKTFFVDLGSRISAFVKESKIFNSIKTFFSDIGAKISKFFSESKLFTSIKTFFVDLGTKISNFFSESKIFTSIKTFFVDVGTKISNIFTSAKTFFVDLGSKISAFFKESDLIKSITKIFTGENSIFSRIGSFFSNIGTKISGIFKESDLLGSIMKFFSGEGSILSKIGSFFGKFTSILGKVAVPITVIMGLFDGVSAAVDEFKKTGDIGSALGEGVKGLITSIVGAPLDLLKSAVSWILGKLGFEEAEGFLDSFSFSDLIGVFIQRVIDWGKGLFEKFFMTIYDVFTDISEGFSKGPIEGIMEILRGFLKTIIAAPLDMVKNTIGSLAGLFGLSSVEESIRGFSFTKMLGGTNTETSADKPTSTKSVWAEAGDKTAEKKLAAEQKKVDDHIAEQDRLVLDRNKKEQAELQKKTEQKADEKKAILESIQNPITVFYDSLIKAYQENSEGIGPQTMQAVPSTVGAEISAMESDTADMEAEAQTGSPTAVVAPQSRTVNSTNQSLTYNSNNMPDRTTWMTTPLASWLGV